MGACLGLVACGGGSGGDPLATPTFLKVTVSDAFGAGIAGATVQGPIGKSTTDASGVAVVLVDPSTNTATLTVSRDTFVDRTVVAPIGSGPATPVGIALERSTAPAGGSMASRSGVAPEIDATGQQLTFEVELVVVDGDSRPIQNLMATDFALRACSPDPANGRVDCVRGAGVGSDVAYGVTTATPQALGPISGGATRSYAAAVLLDQSGSIQASDPTGARLFSSKGFLSGMGAGDRALLAAFASGTGAKIPTPPLAVYGPFRDAASASGYFATLDALVPLVGGNTPLYTSIDALRQVLVADSSLPTNASKAMIVFTDGADTTCGDAETCRTSRAQSIRSARENQVRLFTIGLSSSVDIAALGELAEGTGGALLYADRAEQLPSLYGSVGKLLSTSMPTYRLRWTVQAASAGTFKPGVTLLGQVRVDTGGSSIDVPFVVTLR